MRAKHQHTAAVLAAGLLLSAAPFPAAAWEATPEIGAEAYAAHCAVCHGMDARGEGPYAMYLREAPSDLTLLAAGNGGTFPDERLRRIIDGRKEYVAHGPREMPIWGYEFGDPGLEYYDRLLGTEMAEKLVEVRIDALIQYLRTIQRD